MMKNRALIMAVLFLILCGCGKSDSVEDKVPEKESVEKESTSEAVEFDTKTESIEEVYPTEWSQAYLDYLESIDYIVDDSNKESVLNSWDYSLIFLDDNDIPELMINSNVEAGGEIIVTYYDGEVTDFQLSRIGTMYIPRTGLLYTDTGHMDYYPVSITKLENGKFTPLGEGIYYMSDEERQRISDIEGSWEDIQYTYEWEGVEVSEDEFNGKIASFIDKDLLERPEKSYQISEIRALLETGKWSSYEHRYELIKENVSWQQAFDKAKQNGGYLAIITCSEELDVIKNLIAHENMTNISFYVAYRDCEWVGDTFKNNRWVYPTGTEEDVYILYDFSYLYDADYSYSTFKENEWDDLNHGNAGLLINKATGLYLYNAPDDIVTDVPKYKDHIGYIIEYDN